jgi:hypothetical protein
MRVMNTARISQLNTAVSAPASFGKQKAAKRLGYEGFFPEQVQQALAVDKNFAVVIDPNGSNYLIVRDADGKVSAPKRVNLYV